MRNSENKFTVGEAVEMIVLASHLLGIVDSRTSANQALPPAARSVRKRRS